MSILEELRKPFDEDRIHWRAQTLTRDGSKALALAYLDARDVRHRLNEVVGPDNWSCEHYDCGGGKLGCRLSIRIDGEWITKTDGAGDTQVEAEKGAFSSALKRAAVAWGVGEYLYDMDAVWVPCKTWNKGDKKMFDSFTDDPWKFVKRPPKQGHEPAPEHEARPPANDPSKEDTSAKLDGKCAEIIKALESAKDMTALLAVWEYHQKAIGYFETQSMKGNSAHMDRILAAYTARESTFNALRAG